MPEASSQFRKFLAEFEEFEEAFELAQVGDEDGVLLDVDEVGADQVGEDFFEAGDLEAGAVGEVFGSEADEVAFAGGDALTGPDTVIGAIAAGHQAASDMDNTIRKLNGEPAYEEPAEEKIDIPFIIDEESEEAPQAKMPELHGPDRKRNFKEVELGYKKMIAVLEASRCLRCDAEVD
jgi:hypothetical protein